MSTAVPGRDFDVHEVVTADALLRWLRDARWSDLSYSEMAGDIMGLLVAESLPTSTSEGLLAYQPLAQKLSVNTRNGWVALFEPGRWETRRFKAATCARIGGRIVRMNNTGSDGGAPCVSAGNGTFVYGNLHASNNCFLLDGAVVGAGETTTTDTVYELLGWGLGAAVVSPALANAFLCPIKPNSVGEIITPVTDMTAAAAALTLDAVGALMAYTLAPDGTTASGTYPLYYYGGPLLHVFREDGL